MGARDLLLAAVAHTNLSSVAIPEVPELDGKVYVRVLNAAERHLYGSIAIDASTQGQYISDYEIVAICACEADGTPMFHIRDESGRVTVRNEDVMALRLVDGRAIHTIAMKALEVSGITAGAKAAAGKDSASTQNEEPSSD